jgi:c-di-GMP-binding flagellar brake protein YcgR
MIMGESGFPSAPRRFVRVDVVLQIKFACREDVEFMIKASTLNLSRGGMFIQTNKKKEQGQKVEVELPRPEGGSVLIKGIIRHVKVDQGEVTGLGIEFEELGEEVLAVIDGLLKKMEPPAPT